MKKIIFATICLLAITLTGCTTYQYSARQAGINRQDIQATPTIVDVKADFTKRVEVTSGWCPTKSDAMAECNYRAITENKIDLVVDPIYKIEYRILKRKFKASLIGFAGYYTNSRTQIEDMELIKKLTREDIEKYLIMHNPEVLKYMNAQGEVVNIYHNDGQKKCCKQEEPAPVEAKVPAQAPTKKKK